MKEPHDFNQGGITTTNMFKREVVRTPSAPMRTFVPMTCWPAAAHQRQAEIDFLMRYKSGPST